MTGDPSADDSDRALQRAQVVVAVASYLEAGREPAKLKASICREFPAWPRSTISRWIDHAFKTGAVSRAAYDARAGAASPAVATVTISSINVFAKIATALESIEGVLHYARGEDASKPRNPKLTLAASRDMIRAIQTSLDLHAQLNDARRLDAFHTALIQEIEKESPELAARVLARLSALTGQMGG